MAARNIGSNAMFPPPAPYGSRSGGRPPMATASYAPSSSGTSFIGSLFSGRARPPPAPSDYESSYAGGTSYEGSQSSESSYDDEEDSISSNENKPRKFEKNRGIGDRDYDSDGNSIEEFEVIGDKNLNAFARQLEFQRDPYR